MLHSTTNKMQLTNQSNNKALKQLETVYFSVLHRLAYYFHLDNLAMASTLGLGHDRNKKSFLSMDTRDLMLFFIAMNSVQTISPNLNLEGIDGSRSRKRL
jgi:hypothetical protein